MDQSNHEILRLQQKLDKLRALAADLSATQGEARAARAQIEKIESRLAALRGNRRSDRGSRSSTADMNESAESERSTKSTSISLQERHDEAVRDFHGSESSRTRAVAIFRECALHGHAPSQGWLGHCLLNGLGVATDIGEGLHWYRQAASAGVDFAQFQMGIEYLWGRNYPENPAEGVRWLELASAQGQPDALDLLGRCYVDGRGVRRNRKKGRALIEQAASRGSVSAQEFLSQYKYGQSQKADARIKAIVLTAIPIGLCWAIWGPLDSLIAEQIDDAFWTWCLWWLLRLIVWLLGLLCLAIAAWLPFQILRNRPTAGV